MPNKAVGMVGSKGICRTDFEVHNMEELGIFMPHKSFHLSVLIVIPLRFVCAIWWRYDRHRGRDRTEIDAVACVCSRTF